MRYIGLSLIGIVLLGCTSSSSMSTGGETPIGKTRLGINIGSVVYYSPEVAFKDVLLQGSPWISQQQGAGWGKGGDLAIGEEDNIVKLKPGQYAERILFPDLDGRYPGGEYLCTFEGKGELGFSQSATVLAGEAGKIRIKVDPSKAHLSIQVKAVDAKEPLKNIRLYPANYSEADLKNPFDPVFLKRLEGFQVLRFMDWGRTNNSTIVEWKDRASPVGFQGSDRGVALEYQIALANQLKAEPWFCIPHKASDDYVTQFARLVKEKLDANLPFHVEYSNETWNGIFAQANYCREQGLKRKLSSNAYEAQLRYSSQRSVEIFQLIEKEFGGHERFHRVLAAQGANPWTGTTVLDWQKAYTQADAIAIAPYFGNRLGDPKMTKEVLQGGLDKVFAECEIDLNENKKFLKKYAAEAASRKLELAAYESGQHLVGINGAENNEDLTKLFHAANRDPRMEALYLEDLRNWKECGGGLNCVFSSMNRYSKWGSWGLLEYQAQDDGLAPKYRAVKEFIREQK